MISRAELSLAGAHPVAISDVPLDAIPRYSLAGLFVTVSPHTDRQTHEELLAETFGSVDWLWSGDDEFRFGTDDQELKGFTLAVPEVGSPESWDPSSWLTTEPIRGSLRSLTSGTFDAKPTDMRWVSGTGEQLICASSDASPEPRDLLRLRVAPDMDFVFTGGTYAGWILNHPAAYLVHEWEPAPPYEEPVNLQHALRAYLSMFVEPKIGMMQDGDAGLLSELDSLLAQLETLPSDPRVTVIKNQLTDFRQDWYGVGDGGSGTGEST
ncbi:hypothetical protein ACFVYF_00555 [Streptomyces sp. NPDC058274]|uniref:hypothetical protein n=1 Tax=Streptomyces sp. NPDC058274 TaxID=3346416 RepID=UPI0036F0BC83